MIPDDGALLKSIVKHTLPEECMLLGDATVHAADRPADRPTEAVHVAGGHDFDLAATIALASAAIGLANSFLKIYIDWKNSKPKPPSAAELVAAEAKFGVIRSGEVELKKVAIATAVIEEASPLNGMGRFAAVGLLAFFSGAPIVAAIVALREHSWLTFTCGIIWLIAYQCTLYTAGIRLSFLSIEKASAALVSLSRGNRLERVSLDKYVDPETLASVTSVALITATPLDAKTPVLRALKSFPDPSRRSLIILTEPPGSELSAQTFFLYHELGHLSEMALAETFASKWSPLLLAMVYGPCAVLTTNFWCQLGLFLLYSAELFNTKMRTKAELAADTFAVARCTARFGAARVDLLLTAILKHFARTIRDPRDTAYDTVLEFKVREGILNALQSLLRKDGSAKILQDPTRLYMLGAYQTVIMLFLRLMMVILVNLSPVPVALPVLIAIIAFIVAIALVGTSIQRKYDFKTRKLTWLLERIPSSGEMGPGSPSAVSPLPRDYAK